jgi:threonylcarbamoyladenosine tRNA methylthiotransferase MtaB
LGAEAAGLYFEKTKKERWLRVFVYGLNSCGMRNTVIQSYRDFLKENGHEVVNKLADSEVALIWTCAFRGDVRDNSLLVINRLIREYSGEIIVCGCLPDIDIELLRRYFKGRIISWRNDAAELEKFFGTPNRKLSEIPLVLFKKQLYVDEADYRRKNPSADVPYIGRFIQIYISEGCIWECTYCSERLAFPPYRSFNMDEIVETCHREVERSRKTGVVLLGDSVGDYGYDTGSSLPALIHRLKARVPNIKIALQDFNPFHFLKFNDEMVEFIQGGLIVHLQIPYQSASDRILQLMKRPYSRADIEKVFGTLNSLHFTEFDSHIIVGFPGETEEDFEASVQFAIQHHPKYMLVNVFMESPNMPAAKFANKIEAKIKRRRSAEARVRFESAGIMVNSDNSELAHERFRRLNQG